MIIRRPTQRPIESLFALAAAAAIVLSACSPQASATPAAIAAPAEPALPANVVGASVRVVPAHSAELSFLISAPVRELRVSEGDQVRAGQAIMVLDAPQLEYGMQAAQAAYTSAERDQYIQSQGRRRWNGKKFVWAAGPPEQRTEASARVTQALAGLEKAQAEYDQAVLSSFFDGTVVSIAVNPGEVVQPGQVAAIIGDLSQLQIETTDLSERDVARVRPGQPARITLDALAHELTGTVAAIEPIAGRSEDGDVIYTVTIELDSQPPGLLWGMTGKTQIEVGA